MGPLDTLYEIVGSRFPILSQIVACIVGAVFFGFCWYAMGRHYKKEQTKDTKAPIVAESSVSRPTQSPSLGPSPSPPPLSSIAKSPSQQSKVAPRRRTSAPDDTEDILHGRKKGPQIR